MTVLTLFNGLGGQGLARLLGGLFSGQSWAGAITRGRQNANETGLSLDGCMQALLGILNLPSKADHNRLLSKVEIIQGSLVNLNIKVDRLLAARDRPRREPPDF